MNQVKNNYLVDGELSRLVQHSEFDTNIFGFKVAKILPAKLSWEELKPLLAYLRTQQVRFVIWIADSSDEQSLNAAKAAEVFLGCTQVTYLMNLSSVNSVDLKFSGVEAYQENVANHELEQLAFAAGSLSHFRADPQLPQNLVDNLYRKWIANSCNGVVAKRVLVIRRENKIIGMITLGEKNNRGDIGLLGIDAKFRGQKLGQTLVRAAQAFFINSGYAQLQVVTQPNNTPACRLYETCGFQAEKVENYYHFWL